VPPSFPPPPKVPQVYNNELFNEFLKENAQVRFVYVQWLDVQGTICTRVVPIKEFTRMIHDGDRIGVSPDDNDSAGIASEFYLEPDLRSLSRTHNKDSLPSASVFCYCRAESGVPLPSCPRTSLEALINNLQYTYSTTLFVGFEITVAFSSRSSNADRYQQDLYQPLESTSSIPKFLSEILLALDELNIELQSFHVTKPSEGQYVFRFAPQPPLLAVDSLIQSRQVINQIAATHSIRTSLGLRTSGSQNRFSSEPAKMNMSLHPPTYESNFFAGGVASHLPAICAFTLSSDPRSLNDPLVHKKTGHWTLTCFDTLANPYFALSAVLGAGILGLQTGGGTVMGMEGMNGVTANMPRNINDALHALNSDGPLRQILGEGVVDAVLGKDERHEGGSYGQNVQAPQQFEHDERKEGMVAQPGYDTRQSRESSAYRQPTPAQGGLGNVERMQTMGAQAGFDNRQSRESSAYRQPTPAQGGLMGAQGAYEDNQRRERSPYDTAMGAQVPTETDERERRQRMEERERAEEAERRRDAAEKEDMARQERERRQDMERKHDMESPQSVETMEKPDRRVGFDERSEDAHEK
jgi:glutamine synthetase